MNILLIILGVIVALIVLMLIAALFVKKEYGVSREITIGKPLGEVFAYVRIQKNQEEYNKWVKTDPNKKIETRGTDGTVGFIYAWNGNKQAGEGELELIRIKENEQIDTEVRFKRPFTSSALITMHTTATNSGQTHLRWAFTSVMKYPLNLMLVLMGMEKLLGKDMEVSLNELKGILEKK